LSRAVHLQGNSVPITVRHSNSRSGSPFGSATTASMAVRFYLPNGTTTDLIGLPLPLFPARTPDEVLEFLRTFEPDAQTGQPDVARVEAFLSTRPWIAHAVQLGQALPVSVSLAQTAFHALHAFRFMNAADEARYAIPYRASRRRGRTDCRGTA
jgi:catalase